MIKPKLIYLTVLVIPIIFARKRIKDDEPKTPDSEIDEQFSELFTCTEITCKQRGLCRLNDLGSVSCDCYVQFYTGNRCEKVTNLCVDTNVRIKIPKCVRTYTDMCRSHYGVNECDCKKGFFGRICEFATQNRRITDAQGVLALMPLEPVAGNEILIGVGVIDHGTAVGYEVLFEGVSYSLNLSVFSKIDSQQILATLSNITHLDGNESLPQKHWMGLQHFLINPGYNFVTIRAIYNLDKYSTKVDYTYEYRAIMAKEDCLAYIKFIGGACNPQDSDLVGSTKFQQLVFQRYVRPSCNATHNMDKNMDRFKINIYLSEADVPKSRKDVEVLLNAESLRKILTLAEIYENYHYETRPGSKIFKFPFHGEAIPSEQKMLLIGTAREGVIPNPVPGKLQPEGKLVWAYCWLKYLNAENYLPIIQLDGTNKWRTCRQCTQAIHVFVRDLDLPRFKVKMIPVKLSQKDPYDRLRHYEVISERKYFPIKSKNKVFDRIGVSIYCEDVGNKRKYVDNCSWGTISNIIKKFSFFELFNYNCTDVCYNETQGGTYYSPTFAYGYTNEFDLLKAGKGLDGRIFNKQGTLKTIGFTHPVETHVKIWVDLVSYVPGNNYKKLEGFLGAPSVYVKLFLDVQKDEDMVLKFKLYTNYGQGTFYRRFVDDSISRDQFIKVDKFDYTPFSIICLCFCKYMDNIEWIRCYSGDHNCDSVTTFVKNKGDKITDFRRQGILDKHSFDDSVDYVSIQLRKRGKTYASWNMQYFKLQNAPNPKNDLCMNLPISGIMTEEQLTICNVHVDTDQFFTILFFQNVPEVRSKKGVLIGFSNTPKIFNVWLATSPLSSTYSMTTYELVSIASHEMPYSFAPDLRPPLAKFKGPVSYITFLKDMVEGKFSYITSIEFDVTNHNLFQFVQKVHYTVIELEHMSLTLGVDDNIYLMNTKAFILEQFFKQILKLDTILTLEQIELGTIVKEMVFINKPPLSADVALNAATLMEGLVKSVNSTFRTDEMFNTKVYRILEFIEPMVDLFVITTSDLVVGVDSGLVDVLFINMLSNTRDELLPPPEVQSEDYSTYTFNDTDFERKMNTYREATAIASKALTGLLDILPFYIETRYDDTLYKPLLAIPETTESSKYAIEVISRPLLKVSAFYKKHALWLDCEYWGNKETQDKYYKRNITLIAFVIEGVPMWPFPGRENVLPVTLYHNVRITNDDYSDAVPEKGYETEKYLKPKSIGQDPNIIQWIMFHMTRGITKWTLGTASRTRPLTYLIQVDPNSGQLLTVIFERNSLESQIKTILTAEHEPTIDDFKHLKNYKIIPKKNEEAKIEAHLDEKVTNVTNYYLSITPRTAIAVQVSFAVYVTGCVIINETEPIKTRKFDFHCYNIGPSYDWAIRYHGEAAYYVVCRCKAKYSFIGAKAFPIPHRMIGHMEISIEFQMGPSLYIAGFIFFMVVVYLFCLVCAYILDKRDTGRRVPYYLISNRPGESYMYIIVVITGCEAESTTSSHVGIKIFGTYGNSKRHVLYGIGSDRVILKRRRVDWFCLNTAEPLGNVRAVELWIDNRGPRPHWYCEKCIVRDYQIMREWVFMVQKWFSFVFGDGGVHRICYQRVVPKQTAIQKVFNPETFNIHHIFLGMFTREHCHSFSRVAKTMCCFSIVFTCGAHCMFMLGVAEFSDSANMDEGHFHTDWAVLYGIVAVATTVFWLYPFIYLIKNGQPDRNFVYNWSDFSGIDPTGPIPLYPVLWKYKVAAWYLLVFSQIVSVFLLVMYGFHLGERKSQMWCLSMLVIIVFDACVVESIHVLIRTWIVKVIKHDPGTMRFCNQILNLYVENQRRYAEPKVKKNFLKRDMFMPMPRKVRDVLRTKEENFKHFKKSLRDFLFFLLLLINNGLLYAYFHPISAYSSTKVMRDMIIDDLYTQTMPFTEITSYDTLLQYLNNTVTFVTVRYVPGFMVNSFVRLIGVVRLRQHKLEPGKNFCIPPHEFKATTITRCEVEFERRIMDTKKYNTFWMSYNYTLSKSDKVSYAFVYKSPGESKVFSRLVGYKSVPGGGYIAHLGRTPINTRRTIAQLVNRGWFTNSTRFIFIDFVAYNVHSNLFNVVYLMFETSMSGDMARYYQIYTIRAAEVNFYSTVLQYFLFLLLFLQTLNIIAWHIFQVKRCLVNVQAFQDTIIMICAISTLTMYAYRSVKIKAILEVIGRSNFNQFQNMDEVITLEWWSNLSTGIWCSQNMIHLIDVFHFSPHIRIFYYTLLYALDYILICVCLIIMFVISFSTAFHFILGQEIYLYHQIFLSYIQVFGIPFSAYPTMKFKYSDLPSYIPYVLWTFYGYSFRFLITNMFNIVLNNSYHRARLRLFKQCFKYSILDYIRERMLGGTIKFDYDRMIPLESRRFKSKVVEEEKPVEEEDVGDGKKKKKKKK